MFVIHEVTADVPLETAAARLANLLHEGALGGLCEGAYEGGLTAALRVGPFGRTRGFSKLVHVCFLEPVRRSATITVPLRWEATGTGGDLFPVLDADFLMTRHGDDQTLLAFTGTYRPPLGRTGAVLDKAIMHRVAIATIRILLERLARAITDPAPPRQPALTAGGSRRDGCAAPPRRRVLNSPEAAAAGPRHRPTPST